MPSSQVGQHPRTLGQHQQNLHPGRDKHNTEPDKEVISLFDFEFKLRERIVMNVKKTRGGNWRIPTADF
jgi:hypothetical protein